MFNLLIFVMQAILKLAILLFKKPKMVFEQN